MLRSTFSTTTMASSTTMPMASTRPNMRQVVQRKAEHAHQEERADQRHRNGDDGDDRRAPRLQEQHDDEHHQHDGLEDRVRRPRRPGLLDEFGRIVDDPIFQPGRKILRQLRHRFLDPLRRIDGVGPGQLEHAEADGGRLVEIGVHAIVERGQLDPRHILQAHDGVVGLLDDDLAELVGLDQTTERLHRNLEGAGRRRRRLVEHAGRHLHVLALQRADDIARRQVERLQPIRIEPDAHRIIAAAEHGDRADALDAAEHVDDIDAGVIGNEQGVARIVGREQMHHHHQVGRGLGHGHADVADIGRQARLRDGDAVLHLHLRRIEIGAELEGHRNGEAAVARRIRGDVEHVLDAVDLLLQRRSDRCGDDLRARAGILPGDVDDRRRDLRILRDRQARPATPRRR